MELTFEMGHVIVAERGDTPSVEAEAPRQIVQFRPGELAQELDARASRVEGVGRIAKRDLGRYYTLLHTSLDHFRFTYGEAAIIAGAIALRLVGKPVAIETLHYLLSGVVAEVIYKDKGYSIIPWAASRFATELERSWIDEVLADGGDRAILEMLQGLTPAQALALYDAVERLKNLPLRQQELKEALGIVGLCEEWSLPFD